MARAKSNIVDASPDLAAVVAELRAIRAALSVQGAAVLARDSAAAYLAISTATLDRLTSAGKLRSVRRSLDSYLAAQEAQ